MFFWLQYPSTTLTRISLSWQGKKLGNIWCILSRVLTPMTLLWIWPNFSFVMYCLLCCNCVLYRENRGDLNSPIWQLDSFLKFWSAFVRESHSWIRPINQLSWTPFLCPHCTLPASLRCTGAINEFQNAQKPFKFMCIFFHSDCHSKADLQIGVH